jgi:hypothetical protein
MVTLFFRPLWRECLEFDVPIVSWIYLSDVAILKKKSRAAENIEQVLLGVVDVRMILLSVLVNQGR